MITKFFKQKYIESQSGKFFIDENGVAFKFEPSQDNDFTEYNDNYYTHTHKSIKTFIVPKGVKGFVSDFLRGVKVLEKFELPEGLLSIGNNSLSIEDEINCVFADCILPSVIIPESVKEIGIFAFGHSHIDMLQFPSTLRSPYGRQFKDSCIGTLVLPSEWDSFVYLDEYRLVLSSDNLNFGYLRWTSTSVGKLMFY